MSVVVRQSNVFEVVNAIGFSVLIKEYAEECAIVGLPSPEARIDDYYKFEESGVFDVFAAYEDDHLIGFISLLEYPSGHYGIPLGASESYFVMKSKRRTGAGSMLRFAIKKRASERGLKGVLISAPVNGPLVKVLQSADDCFETHCVFFMGV